VDSFDNQSIMFWCHTHTSRPAYCIQGFFYTLRAMKLPSLLLALCILTFSLNAQNINSGVDEIFRPSELAIIKVTLAPEHKAFLLNPDNAASEEYFPATFYMANSLLDTLLVQQVGIRLRGNTSRNHNKKSFKIDFREYGGKKFFDYKKFNLKPTVNDPSLMREALTMLYYREMQVPAARTHPLKLYMNNEYMGAYINVEQVDDEFLNDRHGHEEGFLYKCSWGADLQNNGQVFNTVMFESEINKDVDTRAELDAFVKILNTTSSTDFKAEIEKAFEVDSYLRQLAVEAMLGHWDGYSYNKNNYYLFYNGQTKRVEFFPYDADNTWGIDWVNRDWATRSLLAWSRNGEPRPLTTRILEVPEFKQRYANYLKELARTLFNEEYLNPLLEQYKSLMSEAIREDSYFDDAFGFTHADFLNSFETALSNHVEYGIKQYMRVRLEIAENEIPDLVTSLEETPVPFFTYPNPSGRPEFTISRPVQADELSVYSSTGVLQSTVVTKQLDKTGVMLVGAAPGLYYIKLRGTVVKWVYGQ
jgi:spore coat protein H